MLVKIAVARSKTGRMLTCGPQDFDDNEWGDPMAAAVGRLKEWYGEEPIDRHWITAEIPEPDASIPTIVGSVDRAGGAGG